MSFSATAATEVGGVRIAIANGRTFTPEEWANMATAKIIHISPESLPEARAQAEAFQAKISRIIAHTIRMALDEQTAALQQRISR